MWLISEKLHNNMIKAKENDIQELTNKVVKQDSLLEKLRDENRTLKQERQSDVRNNTKILEQNNKKTELINNIVYALGKYKEPTVVIHKIKELVHDYQSKN